MGVRLPTWTIPNEVRAYDESRKWFGELSWATREDSKTHGIGTTSAPPEDWSINLAYPNDSRNAARLELAARFSQESARVIARCEKAMKSSDPMEVAYGQHGLAIIKRIGDSLTNGDTWGTLTAAILYGRVFHDWMVKDLVGPDVDFGISRRRLPSIAGKASAEKRRRKALRKARQILREIRGKRVSKAQALRQIDERNLLKPGTTARALQRASKHLPKATKKVATRTK